MAWNSPGRRDRDETGRPRNARPRDRLGRPLPPGSAGVEPVPDDLDVPPQEALGMAQRLLDEGRPFSAHEVLEAVWKGSMRPPETVQLWRGLAQLAVGLTHAERGNPGGAVALLRRAADVLEPYAGDRPYGVDVDGLRGQAVEFADRIRRATEVGEALPQPPVIRLVVGS